MVAVEFFRQTAAIQAMKNMPFIVYLKQVVFNHFEELFWVIMDVILSPPFHNSTTTKKSDKKTRVWDIKMNEKKKTL